MPSTITVRRLANEALSLSANVEDRVARQAIEKLVEAVIAMSKAADDIETIAKRK